MEDGCGVATVILSDPIRMKRDSKYSTISHNIFVVPRHKKLVEPDVYCIVSDIFRLLCFFKRGEITTVSSVCVCCASSIIGSAPCRRRAAVEVRCRRRRLSQVRATETDAPRVWDSTSSPFYSMLLLLLLRGHNYPSPAFPPGDTDSPTRRRRWPMGGE